MIKFAAESHRQRLFQGFRRKRRKKFCSYFLRRYSDDHGICPVVTFSSEAAFGRDCPRSKEESELETEKEDLVPVYGDRVLNYFFYADNWKGHFKGRMNIDDAWIKLEDLTGYDMGPRYNEVMSKFLELYEGRDEDQVG